jgi:hypothetical protein
VVVTLIAHRAVRPLFLVAPTQLLNEGCAEWKVDRRYRRCGGAIQ